MFREAVGIVWGCYQKKDQLPKLIEQELKEREACNEEKNSGFGPVLLQQVQGKIDRTMVERNIKLFFIKIQIFRQAFTFSGLRKGDFRRMLKSSLGMPQRKVWNWKRCLR